MTSSFSLYRVFSHRRYLYTRIALNPQQALDLYIGYRVPTGAWGETPGMCEQLTRQGRVGTEITTDNDARYIAISFAFDEISPFDVFPSVASHNVERACQGNTPVLITSRSCSVAGCLASELWCYGARILYGERWGIDAFIDMSFRGLAGDLQCQGLLLEVPRSFQGGDLSKDHLLTRENVLSIRKAAKKESHHRC